MSVTFSVPAPADHATPPDHDPYECPVCMAHEINLSNANALDLLGWLGLPRAEWGEHPAADLAARAQRRLWDEARNHDPALPPQEDAPAGHARMVFGGRDAGYLRRRAGEILALARRAPAGGLVCWG